MPRIIQPKTTFSPFQRILVASVCVLIGVFILLKLKVISSTVQAPEESDLPVQMQKNIHDFALWGSEGAQNLPFRFFVPNEWSIAAQNPPGLFELLDHNGIARAYLATYSFDKLALQQKNLPESEYKKFGWTNAYGMSLFEHLNIDSETKKLVGFIVNTHTHDVVEITAEGEENIKVVQQMLKTMQPNRSDDDKSLKVFVDFGHEYLFKYLHNYFQTTPSKPEIPVHELSEWQIRGPKEEIQGMLSVTTLPEDEFKNEVEKFNTVEALLNGKTQSIFEPIQLKSLYGNKAVIMQGEDWEFWPNMQAEFPIGRSLLMLKDDEYILIRFGWRDKKALNAHAYEMSELFRSVRMLTEQEKISSTQ